MKEAKRRYVRKPRVVDEEFRAVLESLATDGKDFATNLSGYLLSQGSQVALVDADQPQGTSSAWAYLRRQANKPAPTVSEPQTHRELCANIRQDLHRRLKIAAVNQSSTIGEILEELINTHLP